MTRLVLVGGGHAHALVLESLISQPEPGLSITLVAKEAQAPYSGMLPGHVAGFYAAEEVHIDAARLSERAGARFVHDAVTRVDAAARTVTLACGETLGWDLLSLDVGITPDLALIEGAAEHGISVKPVSTFAPKWAALAEGARSADGPHRIAVVGGGAAGFELILAARTRLRGDAADKGGDPDRFAFTLIAGGGLLEGFPEGARRRARRALDGAGVTLIEHDFAAAVGPDAVQLVSGRRVAADAALMTTKAKPADWFVASGLPRAPDGFLALDETLRVSGHERIFAAGDCATSLVHPRPKAGVFAVRQAPALADNLRRAARGEAPRPFRPQRRWLSILSTADGSAIAARAPFVAEGRWVWRWKDRIDRRFMARFD